MLLKSDVFIIETLDPDDEGNGRFEGINISSVLRMHGKHPKYRYVRTRKEFVKALRQFGKSTYRYLHISSHGNSDGIYTTNQDAITSGELAELLTGVLKNRRIFLSACGAVHEKMAHNIIKKTDCVSVVGPGEDILFTTAAVFWPAIYHLMFSIDTTGMKHLSLKEQIEKARALFDVKIEYYWRRKKPLSKLPFKKKSNQRS